ncbi:hypothetical protein ABRP56_09135 [Pectobacterium odoriferum]|uniref:hypothetical protein n=1 Tax=Pectobacterium odoriferum TaxID=78398 RepID=UPI0032EF5275
MLKVTNSTSEDVFIKIEALASAAQYLTANTEEKNVALDIVEIIEKLANQAQKEINHGA